MIGKSYVDDQSRNLIGRLIVKAFVSRNTELFRQTIQIKTFTIN